MLLLPFLLECGLLSYDRHFQQRLKGYYDFNNLSIKNPLEEEDEQQNRKWLKEKLKMTEEIFEKMRQSKFAQVRSSETAHL